MIPISILRQLRSLRRREVLVRAIWGLARWLTILLPIIMVACTLDWLIDREQDTPWNLRLGMLAAECLVGLWAAAQLILRSLRGGLSDADLALMVESATPELQQRLISAVQLNQPAAITSGMSPELIARTTREAEQLTAGLDFVRAADSRRLRRSALLAGPVLAIALIVLVLDPQLAGVLLVRQLLQDRPIPRSISLVTITEAVQPRGQPAVLRFRAKGPGLKNLAGRVRVEQDGLPAEDYPLEFSEPLAGDEAVFVSRLPPMSRDLIYRAWLDDARLHEPQTLRFVPRPVVTELVAWTILPAYCDPAGRERYSQLQARGDVVGIAGSTARVLVRIQKPVKKAFVKIVTGTEANSRNRREPSGEIVSRRVAIALDAELTSGECTFELRDQETAYRVVVEDEHGFRNVPEPRRTLRLIAEPPPQVGLLREQFPATATSLLLSTGDDLDLEGMPVPLGGSIRIAYACSGPYGLGRARLLFRILPKLESDGAAAAEPKWIALPLPEVQAAAATGDFDPEQGAFVNSGPRDQVPFHVLAGAPGRLGRTLGGGRFDFQTIGIPDGQGGRLKLKEGDTIEYCLEVFVARDPGANRPSARSETRTKRMAAVPDFIRWLDDALQEERRLRELDARQRRLFDSK